MRRGPYSFSLYAWAVQQPPHHLLLSYGNFCRSLCGRRWPAAKNIQFWSTTGIRRAPCLCSLSDWAVQQPPRYLILSYGNSWGRSCGPRWLKAKNIKLWLTSGIRRGPYLCRLYAWAVQQPPHHLLLSYGNFSGSLRSPRWPTAKNIKIWRTTWIRRGPYLCRLYA